MRHVTLKLDLPNGDPRSSSILEAVLYELIRPAAARTLDYLRIAEVQCGTAVARPDGDYFASEAPAWDRDALEALEELVAAGFDVDRWQPGSEADDDELVRAFVALAAAALEARHGPVQPAPAVGSRDVADVAAGARAHLEGGGRWADLTNGERAALELEETP